MGHVRIFGAPNLFRKNGCRGARWLFWQRMPAEVVVEHTFAQQLHPRWHGCALSKVQLGRLRQKQSECESRVRLRGCTLDK